MSISSVKSGTRIEPWNALKLIYQEKEKADKEIEKQLIKFHNPKEEII